jgi:hypothetical protein
MAQQTQGRRLVLVRVRVGFVPDLGLQHLQSLLGALYVREPHLRAQVTHLCTAEQLARLHVGGLDLAVVHDAGDVPGIERVPVFKGAPLAAYMPVGRHATGSVLRARSLDGEVLLLGERAADPDVHDRLLERIVAAGYSFKHVEEAGGADLRDLLFAAAEGNGVALAQAAALDVVGGADRIVTRHALDPAIFMPDTMLAWPAEPPPHVVAHARVVAPLLYAG